MRNLTSIFCLFLSFTVKAQQDDILKQFTQTQTAVYTIEKIEKDEYPPFLGHQKNYNSYEQGKLKAKKTHKNKNSYGLAVRQRIDLYRYTYKDEATCKLAADSLLNCFPDMCCKIIRGKDGSCKITVNMIIFNKKNVFIAKTLCEHQDEKWENFRKDFAKYFAEDDADILLSECAAIRWTNKKRLSASKNTKLLYGKWELSNQRDNDTISFRRKDTMPRNPDLELTFDNDSLFFYQSFSNAQTTNGIVNKEQPQAKTEKYHLVKDGDTITFHKQTLPPPATFGSSMISKKWQLSNDEKTLIFKSKHSITYYEIIKLTKEELVIALIKEEKLNPHPGNFISFEENAGGGNQNSHYVIYDTSEIKKMLMKSDTIHDPYAFAYRFWIVENYGKVKLIEHSDSTNFDLAAIRSKSIKKELTYSNTISIDDSIYDIRYSLALNIHDSLSKANIDHFFHTPLGVRYKYQLYLEGHFPIPESDISWTFDDTMQWVRKTPVYRQLKAAYPNLKPDQFDMLWNGKFMIWIFTEKKTTGLYPFEKYGVSIKR